MAVRDEGFEQFRRDFASPEGRARYGQSGYSQAHAEALIANYDRGVNSTLVGIHNGWLAQQRAVASAAVRSAAAAQASSTIKQRVLLGLLLVVVGLAVMLSASSAAAQRTTETKLPCYEHQYTGRPHPEVVCPVHSTPNHDGVWLLLVGASVAGGAALLGGIVLAAKHPLLRP